VQQGVIERRVLIDPRQPGEHFRQRVLRHPHAERFVQPEAVLVEAIEAQKPTCKRDDCGGKEREPILHGKGRRPHAVACLH
jgi:hypothetical protein